MAGLLRRLDPDAPGGIGRFRGPMMRKGSYRVGRQRATRWLSVVFLLVSMMSFTATFPSAAHAADALAVGSGAVVTADLLNLRGGPGTENPIVDVLPAGTALKILGGPAKDIWWRVTDGTRVGFVDGDFLASGPAPDDTAFDLDLNLPYHRQMTAVWCDPADLQTWVEYTTGRSLGPSTAVQQRFWDWELAHNAGFTVDQWDASPFAVASAAHQWMPNQGFNHFIYDSPTRATSMMAWLLANPAYHAPSVATIWWGDHYVLVRGVRATADPYAAYPGARILGVYVMDPNQGRPSWLGEDRYIPMDAWTSRYLTPVTYLTPGAGVPGDVWQGKYVTMQRDWSTGGPTLAGRVNASPGSYRTAGG